MYIEVDFSVSRCVHILVLERDMIKIGSLDHKVFVNGLWDPSRKLKDIFSQCPFWAPENAQNRPK